MGLAASQARLLFITARKSDVEFSMMRIANNKIDLSRETTDLAEQHSRALNQRKFMWDADGGTSDNAVDLTYNLLMSSSAAGSDSQYLFADRNGRVILSDEYLSKLGLGASGNAGALASTYPKVADFLKKFGLTGDYGISDNQNTPGEVSIKPVFTTNYSDSKIIDYLQSKKGYAATIIKGESPLSLIGEFNVAGSAKNRKDDLAQNATTLEGKISDICGDIAEAVLAQIGSGFSGQSAEAIAGAIDIATQKTKTQFISGDFHSRDREDALGAAQMLQYNGPGTEGYYVDFSQVMATFLTYFDAECAKYLPEGQSDTSPGSISNGDAATQTGFDSLGDYLTFNMDEFVDTIASLFGGGSKVLSVTRGAAGTGATNGSGNTANNSGSVAIAADEQAKAEYYANLYNALNSKGWSSNSNITNSAYFQNALRNGGVTIQSLNSDGSWSPLSSGDPSSPVRDVRDTEGIAAEQTRYEIEKSKLETKEEELDLQMKNLDTERSALDTEIDSVKTIINKNIERSFKMFQA